MFKNDTVRLKVKFRDFDGNVINPTEIKLVIYNKQEEVVQTITDGIVDLTQGNYQYDYTDTTGSDFIFEFSGVFNSKSVLARQVVEIKFI